MLKILKKFIIISLILNSPLLFAQNGSISYLEGDVTIKRVGTTEYADFGTQVREGDTIITGYESLAIINLENNRVIKLREDTILTIQSIGKQSSLQLDKGGVFSKVQRLTGWGFTVNTESVVAGVRGTEFFVAFGRSVEETRDVWLCVNEGSVNVSVPASNQTVIVNEGEGINILAGKRLTDPTYFEWTDDLIWNTDPSSGSVKDSTDLNAAYSDLLDQDYE